MREFSKYIESSHSDSFVLEGNCVCVYVCVCMCVCVCACVCVLYLLFVAVFITQLSNNNNFMS